MWILGIAGSHNSGVALIEDGRVVVAVQTERLVRVKRHAIATGEMGSHAAQAIAYCLRYAGIDLPDVDAIATCTPWVAVRPRFAFTAAPAHYALPPFVTVPHHLAHAEYAIHYAPAPCLVLVCDGSGTFECQRADLDIREAVDRPLIYGTESGKESISAYMFDGADLKLRYRIAYGDFDPRWLLSVGHVWEWCAQYRHGSFHEAGKVMGLAPFGDPAVHADLHTLSIDGDGRVHVDFAPLLARFVRRTTRLAT